MPKDQQTQDRYVVRVSVHASKFDHGAFRGDALALCGRAWRLPVPPETPHKPLCVACRAVAIASGVTVPR